MCDKVDRLSRNMFDKRVSILYEKALIDQIELCSDTISDNIKRANEQKLRKGEWTCKAPFGYKNITKADDKKDIILDAAADSSLKKLLNYTQQKYIPWISFAKR